MSGIVTGGDAGMSVPATAMPSSRINDSESASAIHICSEMNGTASASNAAEMNVRPIGITGSYPRCRHSDHANQNARPDAVY
jgi:hypothetical protein